MYHVIVAYETLGKNHEVHYDYFRFDSLDDVDKLHDDLHTTFGTTYYGRDKITLTKIRPNGLFTDYTYLPKQEDEDSPNKRFELFEATTKIQPLMDV